MIESMPTRNGTYHRNNGKFCLVTDYLSSVGSIARRVGMRPDWVTYFFLTAAASLSMPQFMTLFESGRASFTSRLLQVFAGFIVVSAIALGFRENGLLASLIIFVYSYSISPLLLFQDRFRVASVCASAVCLLISIGLL